MQTDSLHDSEPRVVPASTFIADDTYMVPSMVVGPLVEEQEPVLLWVHTGKVTVEADGSNYRLSAGDAIWVPPGVEHCTRTDVGAVVFPYFLRPAKLPGVLAEVHTVTIPAGWKEWMVHRWDDNSYASDPLPGWDVLLGLVAGGPASDNRTRPEHSVLRLPRSREALDVARTLLRNPASRRGIEPFARRERVSAKTLQRQFLKETGLSFSAWRTRARIAIAARHLSEGRRAAQAGRDVGYATPAGFSKAFRLHTGLTPRDYALQHRDGAVGAAAPNECVEHALTIDPLEERPGIPARTFWEKVNDHHELMWVYRGEVTLRIGPRHWKLSKGQAIWVPAGLTHTVEFATESLMLTVSTAHGRARVELNELIVFAFAPEWEAFLLHTMVSEYTLFRPATDHKPLMSTLFREQFISTRVDTRELAGILGEIARLLRRDPANSRSLADWAAHFRTTPEKLGAEFLTQTGVPFPHWRARIRLDVARELLRFGEPPGQVFRKVGYTSPATLARSFRTAYGMSPREYQRREYQHATVPPPLRRQE